MAEEAFAFAQEMPPNVSTSRENFTLAGVVVPGIGKVITASTQETKRFLLFGSSTATLSVDRDNLLLTIDRQQQLCLPIAESSKVLTDWEEFLYAHTYPCPEAPPHPAGKRWHRIRSLEEFRDFVEVSCPFNEPEINVNVPANQSRREVIEKEWQGYDIDAKKAKWETVQGKDTFDEDRGYLLRISVPTKKHLATIPPDLVGIVQTVAQTVHRVSGRTGDGPCGGLADPAASVAFAAPAQR